MTVKSISQNLSEEGWNVQDKFLLNLQQERNIVGFNDVVKVLLNTDIKKYGISKLAEGKGQIIAISTPIILQITNVRNLSAPKANESSEAAPRMLRLTLTDGSNSILGLEVDAIKAPSSKFVPGTKIKLSSKISLAGSYFLLGPSNTDVLGGVVEELYEKWRMFQSVSKYARNAATMDGSGPPVWVPFGKSIVAEQEKEKNFKALSVTEPTSGEKDHSFEQARNKTLSELNQTGHKTFGGGKQMLDSNVKKIVNVGPFTIEEAEWALKKTRDDPRKSVQLLQRIHLGQESSDFIPEVVEESPRPSRGRGKRGRRGREDKGPDGSDDEITTPCPRPSGPASLFDFLDSKIRGNSEPIEEPQVRGARSRGDYRSGRSRNSQQQRQPRGSHDSAELSQQHWPTLGMEPEKDLSSIERELRAGSVNNEYKQRYGRGRFNSSGGDDYYSDNYGDRRRNDSFQSRNQSRRGDKSYRRNNDSGGRQQRYNDRQSYSSYEPRNFHSQSERPPKSHPNMGQSREGYRAHNDYRNQNDYRGSSDYRGSPSNSRSQNDYRDSSNYRENPPNSRSQNDYKDSSNYRENPSNSRSQNDYRTPSDYRETPSNSRSQNDYRASSNYRETSSNSRSQNDYRGSSNYRETPSNYKSQNDYRASSNYREAPSNSNSQSNFKSSSGSKGTAHTDSQREMIAQFQQCMISEGLYEDAQTHNQYNQNYQNSRIIDQQYMPERGNFRGSGNRGGSFRRGFSRRGRY